MHDETSILLAVLLDSRIQTERELLQHTDRYTWRHSMLTCCQAVRIGRELGIGGEDLYLLGLSAFLHDLGKCFIREEILLKPGPLTAEERAEVEFHTTAGGDVLGFNPDLPGFVSLAAYEHHENEDGSGYPEGKTGEMLHPFSRIIHVADVYDALTSPRPYKKELSPGDALSLVEQGSGKLFLPESVEALRRALTT